MSRRGPARSRPVPAAAEPALAAVRRHEDRIADRLKVAEVSEQQVVEARRAADQLLDRARTEARTSAAAAAAELVDAARRESDRMAAEASAEAGRISETASRHRSRDVDSVVETALGESG